MGGSGVVGVSFMIFFVTTSEPSLMSLHVNVLVTVTVMGGPPLTGTVADGE